MDDAENKAAMVDHIALLWASNAPIVKNPTILKEAAELQQNKLKIIKAKEGIKLEKYLVLKRVTQRNLPAGRWQEN